MNRRDFIKISTFGLGAAALSNSILDTSGSIPKQFLKDILTTRTPTYCEICFWKCAGWVYKNETGEIWKITGNDDDPHCNGRLCPRGTGGIGMYNDEDRLKSPLIRVNERGKQIFREVSWDEAFEYIAKKMKYISDKFGPETMALFSHGSGGKLLTTLMKAYGSDSIASLSYAQCKGPREVAFAATFGDVLESPEPTDIRDTKCLVLIGSHIGENMHNSQVQEMSEAIDKDAVIITVDPRYSISASKSKYWLPIKASTDIALLLAWINVLIYEDLYDKKYVDKYCSGFDKLKDHVKNYTPEWAYGISTIEPDLIRKTAKEMANASPAVIVHPGRHVTWYGDDTQRIRAIAILNALLGSYGKHGGFYFPESISLAEYPHPEFPKINKSWREASPDKYLLAEMPLANIIVDASIPGKTKGLQYKGWIVNGSNLIFSLPNIKNTIKAIQNLELLVAIDTMPMEITGWADVVLPECTYIERYDPPRNDHFREPNIALRMPAAKPKYNSKPSWWIVKELSKKLELNQYFAWNSIEEFLDYKFKKLGTSLSEMQKTGVKKFKRETNLYLSDDEDHTFNTDSGKIELYSTLFEQQGFDPLPVYTEHEQPPENFYRLIYGRAPMHTFSRTTNNQNLNDLMSENSIWINPKVANKWDLKNDQYIKLQNQDGIVSSSQIKVRITERIGWDSVYLVHGFGHSQKQMKRSYKRGVSDSELITKVLIDPIMGGTGMRSNFVTFKTDWEELS